MIKHKVAPFLTALLTIFTIATELAAQDTSTDQWNVIEEEGKKYISISDIEKFYDFKGGFYAQKPPGYRMFHTNLELGFQYEANQFMFNKVPIAAFEPLVKKKNDLLVSIKDLSFVINPVLTPQRIQSGSVYQFDLSFGGGDQAEPAFFNQQMKYSGFARVETADPKKGGIAIQINRQPISEGQKTASLVWTYDSDPKLVAQNHRNVALATSMSAYLGGFKNLKVDKVTAKPKSAEASSDLIINLAIKGADEEPVWKALLQSVQKYNNSLWKK